MVPAVAQALQRLTPAAMTYPARPGNTAHRHLRARRDRANEADVNINLPTMHDKSSCLGSIRSCVSGRRLPTPIIRICGGFGYAITLRSARIAAVMRALLKRARSRGV